MLPVKEKLVEQGLTFCSLIFCSFLSLSPPFPAFNVLVKEALFSSAKPLHYPTTQDVLNCCSKS